MTNQQKPEALRLADEFKLCNEYDSIPSINDIAKAEAELRRLNAENERLAALVDAQQRAPSAAAVVNPDPHAELRKTWQPGQRWQARSFRNGQWGPWTDAVASEPFWFPHQDYRRHPDDLAPQPSTTAQAASSAVLKAIREANMQLVRTGDDEFMLVTYKNAKAQCDGGKCGIGGYCDDCPTPQADSQPAPDEIINMAREQGLPETEIKGVFRVNVDDLGRMFAADRAARAPADPQLLKFYGVTTDAELIAVQARHIERLQAKLPQAPSFAPQQVREG